MGIRFNTNTWRAPLQLIDCWLPVERASALTKPKVLPQSLQKFASAGWLKRALEPNATNRLTTNVPRQCATVHNLDAHRKTSTHAPRNGAQTDTRLVISGRIGDVCAELDRLAAMELRAYR